MAVFNPQIQPTQDPNYFRYSEPISDLKAVDKSSALMMEGIGSAIEGTAKLADDTAKDFLGTAIHKKVDALRSDFTNDLQTVLNAQRGIAPPTQSGPIRVMAFDDDGSTQESVPAGIDSGLKKVDGIQSALTNGKINDTYYTQRLSALAVDMRTRYPGYRDYIDQRIAQATGGDPANATVQNLMQDINRHAVNKKTEEDKILDMARSAMTTGLPGSKEQYGRLQMDPLGYKDKFLDWYTSANENKYAIEGDNARRVNRKGSREEIAADDEAKFTDLVGKTVQTNFKSVLTIAGIDTPQGTLDFMGKVAAMPDDIKSTQMEALATKLLLQKNTLATQLKAMSNESRDGIPSYASTLGSKRDEIIKSQLEVYDYAIQAIKDDKSGLASYHLNHANAVLADRKDNLLTGPIGQDLATFKTLQDMAGPTWTSLIIDSGLRANIDKKMRPLFEQSSVEARAQPDFDSTGKPITMQQHIEKANQLQKDGKITEQMKGRYINNLVNIVDDLKNPQAPDAAKINVVRYLFSPEGRGILNNIKTDYTDPETGKLVPGKYAVFSRLTSEDVVQNVAKLAKSHPEIGEMYKSYLENEAGSQLFYKELQNLNRFTGHDDLHFKYDSGANGIPRIALIDKNGAPVNVIERPYVVPGQWNRNKPAEDAAYLEQINKVVNRINGGLASLGRVENGLGGDANEFLLNFLQRSQVDLGKNWEGLPQKLIDAVAASRAPARRIEDTFQDAKGKNK